MIGRGTRRTGAWGWIAGLAVVTSAAAEPAFDPPAGFIVRGTGRGTLSGPRCCGDHAFTGGFEARYSIAASSEIRLERLQADIDDTTVLIDGFLGLFDQRADLRCTRLDSASEGIGWRDGSGRLWFPPGALRLTGASSAKRYEDGTCTEPAVRFDLQNDAWLSAEADPVANRFRLSGTLNGLIDGDPYTLTLDLQGGFANRPPAAALDVLTPLNPQGGCPAWWRWVPATQSWEQVAEANHPGGLRATLRSATSDPDGLWARGDVGGERWFDTRDGGTRKPLGDGPVVGPLVFEWGPEHRLELFAHDQQGAAGAAACTFRVVDTIAPVVTPPAPLTVGCSVAGGATRASSPALEAFLAGATAHDDADASPAAAAALAGGSPVTDTTLFPADGWPRAVTFRFLDDAGNQGEASADVIVLDTAAPTLSVSPSPAALPPDGKWWAVTATLDAFDDCGAPLTFSLVSIQSNAPAFDPTDILDAAYGSDDRDFLLFSRPAPGGGPRFYKITYEVRDAAGNARSAVAQVTVG